MPLPKSPPHDHEEQPAHLEATETRSLQEEMLIEEESLKLFMNRNTGPISTTKPDTSFASTSKLTRPPLL